MTHLNYLWLAIWIGMFLYQQNAQAQGNVDLSVETKSGYEYNVFNANEDRTFLNQGVTESALKSGYFQNLTVGASWRLSSKHHYFKISGKVQKDYFPELRIADLYRPYAKLKYTLKLNKSHSFSVSAKHSRYRTLRLENEEEVLRPPRAYDRSSASVKYTMKLFQGNQIYIQSSLIQHAYLTDANRDFRYNALESIVSLTQAIWDSKKQSHTVGVKGEYAVRRYYDTTYDETTDLETFKEREWKYYQLTGEYIWSIKKRFKLTLGMNALERQDLIQDRFGYRQYQPFLKMVVKSKKVELSLRGSAARREYHTLKAQTGNEELLVHEYLRASVGFKWKVTKKLHIISKASGVRRTRNLPEGARSFLGYDNATITFGFKYNIF